MSVRAVSTERVDGVLHPDSVFFSLLQAVHHLLAQHTRGLTDTPSKDIGRALVDDLEPWGEVTLVKRTWSVQDGDAGIDGLAHGSGLERVGESGELEQRLSQRSASGR
ncbi:hypothetical protein [Sorangium sp. So ce117]|uniref:hypothetical protein n=1 Tax=Sorangium sp. So ce117 TaxID=3133277 RepID=UPI003F606736